MSDPLLVQRFVTDQYAGATWDLAGFTGLKIGDPSEDCPGATRVYAIFGSSMRILHVKVDEPNSLHE